MSLAAQLTGLPVPLAGPGTGEPRAHLPQRRLGVRGGRVGRAAHLHGGPRGGGDDAAARGARLPDGHAPGRRHPVPGARHHRVGRARGILPQQGRPLGGNVGMRLRDCSVPTKVKIIDCFLIFFVVFRLLGVFARVYKTVQCPANVNNNQLPS